MEVIIRWAVVVNYLLTSCPVWRGTLPKLYLTIDTNLNGNVTINTYQYGDNVFTHDAVIHSGSNEVTLQYPSGLIDTGEFRICVIANNYDASACSTGYNSEAKQPEHVFISLFVDDVMNAPDIGSESQAQSQNQDNEQSQSQSQNNEQTTIICQETRDCVIQR